MIRKVAFSTLAVLASLSIAAAAEDGAAIFKTKCVACHGPNGAGKPALKGTDLLADKVKKASDKEMTDAILLGGTAKKPAHAYEKKGVTADQAKALVTYIRSLQK